MRSSEVVVTAPSLYDHDNWMSLLAAYWMSLLAASEPAASAAELTITVGGVEVILTMRPAEPLPF